MTETVYDNKCEKVYETVYEVFKWGINLGIFTTPPFKNTSNKQISYKTSSDKVINTKIPHCIEKSSRKLKAEVNNFSAGKMLACIRDCVWEAVCSYLRDSCWGSHLEYLTSLTCNVMFFSKNVRPPMRQHTRRNVKQARL